MRAGADGLDIELRSGLSPLSPGIQNSHGVGQQIVGLLFRNDRRLAGRLFFDPPSRAGHSLQAGLSSHGFEAAGDAINERHGDPHFVARGCLTAAPRLDPLLARN